MTEKKVSEKCAMPFATGKLGGEFRLLRAYIDEAGTEDIIPESWVFEKIKSIASAGTSAEDAIRVIAESFIDKIDPSAAADAYTRVYGVRVSEEEAVKAVAREAAAWVIEVAESLGVIKLRGYVR